MASGDSYVRRHYVQQHLPLITPRIEFKLSPRPPLPLLTARTEFKPEELMGAHSAEHEPSTQRTVTFQVRGDKESQVGPRLNVHSSSPASVLAGGPSSSPSRRNETKILKPTGEPGRPGSGGYCLETILVETYNWTTQEVDALEEAVRALVRKKLNTKVSYRSQRKEIIKEICQKMEEESDQWPQLKNYDDCWPVTSIMKLTLKYYSEASRKNKERAVGRQILDAARGRVAEVESSD